MILLAMDVFLIYGEQFHGTSLIMSFSPDLGHLLELLAGGARIYLETIFQR